MRTAVSPTILSLVLEVTSESWVLLFAMSNSFLLVLSWQRYFPVELSGWDGKEPSGSNRWKSGCVSELMSHCFLKACFFTDLICPCVRFSSSKCNAAVKKIIYIYIKYVFFTESLSESIFLVDDSDVSGQQKAKWNNVLYDNCITPICDNFVMNGSLSSISRPLTLERLLFSTFKRDSYYSLL